MIKILRFLKPYRLQLLVIIVLAFGQSMANLYLPNLMANIVDVGIVNKDIPYIWRTGGLMILVTFGGVVAAFIGVYFASRTATLFGKDIRAALFKHVQKFSLHEFDTVSSSSLITRTTNDTTQVQQVMVIILNIMITAPFTLVAGIILAVNQDAALSWILVVMIPVVVGSILLLMTRAIPLFMSMQKKLDRLNLVVDEGLTGVRVVRAFDRQKSEEQRFDGGNTELTNIAIRVNQLMASMMPVMMFSLNVTSVAIIWFGGQRINNGQMQVGALIAFLQYAMQILFSLLMVSMMFIMIPRAAASADRINQALAIKPEIADPQQPEALSDSTGYVEFKDVSFSYPGAEENAISNISFKAAPGEMTAIIGGTGSGKSTLINLIPRFYDVGAGSVLVDGVDVRNMRQEDLRQKIGYVPQKAVLFSGTISDNIRYGNQNATSDEIQRAAEIAQATEFIADMEDTFDSYISQGGTNVSGGQKQRLSIARALVKKPEIYIFDESFSALDFKTDAKLRAALRTEIKNSTVFIVSQRVSTVMGADRIIVLDEGQIAGMGDHKTLMANCDVYREIVATQLTPEEIA